MHNFKVNWNESVCRKSGRVGLEQVYYDPMQWRPLQNNLIHWRWMMMGLLPWIILKAQQHILLLKSSHIGLYSLCLRCKVARQYIWNSQVITPLTCRNIYWTLTISWSISSPGSKPSKWSCLTSISCGVWWWIFHSYIHERRHNTPKLDRSCATQLTNWWTR